MARFISSDLIIGIQAKIFFELLTLLEIVLVYCPGLTRIQMIERFLRVQLNGPLHLFRSDHWDSGEDILRAAYAARDSSCLLPRPHSHTDDRAVPSGPAQWPASSLPI